MIQAMPVRTAFIPLVVVGLFAPAAGAHGGATAPTPDPAKRLASVDAYMEKVVKDWNVPGIGVAVIVKDKVVHAKGYGMGMDLTPWSERQLAIP